MLDQSLIPADQQFLTALQGLLRDGYLVVDAAVDREEIGRVRDDLQDAFCDAPFCNGPFYGATTKRFGRLLARLRNPDAFVLHKGILALVRAVLGEENGIQLNLSQAIEIHPGAPVQVPHRDHDMWRFDKTHGTSYMVNVMWPLDAFTAENGATRVWPGTNRSDWSIMIPPERECVSALADIGSAIIFLGQTLHSGGANRSGQPRRGMIFSYCLDWLLPDENPWLAYPPHIACRFSPELAALAGYRQRFAGLNNFEGSDPSILLADDVPKYLRFTDDMSPDQQALIAGYYDGLARHEAL